jgi:hypothetical protein
MPSETHVYEISDTEGAAPRCSYHLLTVIDSSDDEDEAKGMSAAVPRVLDDYEEDADSRMLIPFVFSFISLIDEAATDWLNGYIPSAASSEGHQEDQDQEEVSGLPEVVIDQDDEGSSQDAGADESSYRKSTYFLFYIPDCLKLPSRSCTVPFSIKKIS